MPESNGSIKGEVLSFLEERFGVSPSYLDRLNFQERSGQIWVTTGPSPLGIARKRPPGLRAFRRMPDGLKPTSSFLILLGERITSSRIDLSRDELYSLLLGRPAATAGPDGYVALSYNGDVVGCGRIRAGKLQALIPTGRRRELLEILSAD